MFKVCHNLNFYIQDKTYCWNIKWHSVYTLQDSLLVYCSISTYLDQIHLCTSCLMSAFPKTSWMTRNSRGLLLFMSVRSTLYALVLGLEPSALCFLRICSSTEIHLTPKALRVKSRKKEHFHIWPRIHWPEKYCVLEILCLHKHIYLLASYGILVLIGINWSGEIQCDLVASPYPWYVAL